MHTYQIFKYIWLFLVQKRITNWVTSYPQQFTNNIYHIVFVSAGLKAHPQFHFQLAAPRKAVMKAVAKEHSDVTVRLQTQTVNSTLWVACHHHQLPRESWNTWLSQPSAQFPTNTTANHRGLHPLAPPTHYLAPSDCSRNSTAERGDWNIEHKGSFYVLEVDR